MIAPIAKDRQNSHFKNRYASLDAVLSVVEPALETAGVYIFNEICAQRRVVVTTLWHDESGEEISSTFPLPVVEDPQKVGSAIAYGRRYNLTSLLNLRFDDDDDANLASGHQQSQSRQQQRSPYPPQPQSANGGRTISREEWQAARAAAATR